MPKLNRTRGTTLHPGMTIQQLWDAGFHVEAMARSSLIGRLSGREPGPWPGDLAGPPKQHYSPTPEDWRAAYELRVKIGLNKPGDAHLYGIHTYCNPEKCDRTVR